MRDVFRDDVFRAALFREDLRFRAPLRGGTFAPLLLASLNAIAIACLRLLTFRPELLFSVPRLRRRIVDSTFFEADLPYFAMCDLPVGQRFSAAIGARRGDANCVTSTCGR